MTEANSGAGRPPKYKPEYASQAQEICERFGATDYDLARIFKVTQRTVERWKLKYPEFCRALKIGKDGPDDRVERALFTRAVGYHHDAVKIFMPAGAKKPVYAKYVEHHPPDVTACAIWLNNRRPDKWRQKPEGNAEEGEERAARVLETIRQAEENV